MYEKSSLREQYLASVRDILSKITSITNKDSMMMTSTEIEHIFNNSVLRPFLSYVSFDDINTISSVANNSITSSENSMLKRIEKEFVSSSIYKRDPNNEKEPLHLVPVYERFHSYTYLVINKLPKNYRNSTGQNILNNIEENLKKLYMFNNLKSNSQRLETLNLFDANNKFISHMFSFLSEVGVMPAKTRESIGKQQAIIGKMTGGLIKHYGKENKT